MTTNGQIAVESRSSAPAIYTYNQPEGGSLGDPVATTPITNSAEVSFVFSSDMKHLYTAYAAGMVNEYAYPAGGSPVSSFPAGKEPFGIAVIPAQYPGAK